MNLIMRNTVAAFSILLLLSACEVSVSSTTTTQVDKDYSVDDIESIGSTGDLTLSDQESGDEEGLTLSDQESSDEEGLMLLDQGFDGEEGLTLLDQEAGDEALADLTSGIEGVNVVVLEEGGLASTKEDESMILVGLLASGATKIVKVDNGSVGGEVVLLDDGNVQYTPKENFFGVEYFKYYTSGKNENLIVSTVIVEVEAVNDSPEVIGEAFSGQEDEVLVFSGLLKNDTDVDGDEISLQAVSQGDNGGLVELLDNGDVKYTPMTDFFGTEIFKYTVADNNGAVTDAEVVVSIAAVNDVPVAKADSIVLIQDEESIFDLGYNDTGVGDGVQFSVVSAPTSGDVIVAEDGIASYLPDAGYSGLDEFSYQVVDADGDVSIATVSLQIDCVINCTRTFNLSWDASVSTDVTGYKVYVGESADALNEVVEVGNVLQFDHLVSLKGEYYFAVSAVNSSAIESELSVIQSAIF